MFILFPCEYNNLTKADSDFEMERQIANKCEHKTLLFNYDDYVFLNKSLVVTEKPNTKTKVIYRGWMMQPEEYEKFYNDLMNLNIELINSPEEYENAHCFNKVYTKIKDFSPKTIFFNKNEKINFDNVKKEFSRWIMKDYVKSAKGYDFPNSFCDTMDNEMLEDYVEKFIELRGKMYTGGICLKEYIDLVWNNKKHEFRAFFYNGVLKLIYPNSNNYEDIPPLDFAKKLPILQSNFYTIDFAILENGKIIVIEAEDGQVSGIENVKYMEKLYNKLKNYENICFLYDNI